MVAGIDSKESAPAGGDYDRLRPVRASKRVFAEGNRGQGIRHLLRLLESAGEKNEGQRQGEKGAGDGLPAAAGGEAGAAGTQTGAWKTADDLG